MPVSPKRKRKLTAVGTGSTSQTIDDQFTQTLSVIDSAFTAALISGVSPFCLQAVLSYAFLNTAARRRSRTNEFEQWLEPDRIWEPILGEVLDFLEKFDGDIDSGHETIELDYLRNECNIKNLHLSEIEERKHNKTAFALISWLIKTLDEQNHDLIFVECGFFVEWFKVGVLTEKCSERNYLIVRQNVPEVANIWDQMI